MHKKVVEFIPDMSVDFEPYHFANRVGRTVAEAWVLEGRELQVVKKTKLVVLGWKERKYLRKEYILYGTRVESVSRSIAKAEYESKLSWTDADRNRKYLWIRNRICGGRLASSYHVTGVVVTDALRIRKWTALQVGCPHSAPNVR